MFQNPLNPRCRTTSLIVEKCKYFSSKKKPLFLVFNNEDGKADPGELSAMSVICLSVVHCLVCPLLLFCFSDVFPLLLCATQQCM